MEVPKEIKTTFTEASQLSEKEAIIIDKINEMIKYLKRVDEILQYQRFKP